MIINEMTSLSCLFYLEKGKHKYVQTNVISIDEGCIVRSVKNIRNSGGYDKLII